MANGRNPKTPTRLWKFPVAVRLWPSCFTKHDTLAAVSESDVLANVDLLYFRPNRVSATEYKT